MVSLNVLVCTVVLWLQNISFGHNDGKTAHRVHSFSLPQSVLSPSRTLSTFTTKTKRCIAAVMVHQNGNTPTQHLSALSQPQQRTDIDCKIDSRNKLDITRRDVLTSAYSLTGWIAVTFVITVTTFTSSANALQPRNEPLCSTGLFEHFMEYKCTPIGDIADEGRGKKMSLVEERTTDALLYKLGIDDNVAKRSEEKVKEVETSSIKTNMNPETL